MAEASRQQVLDSVKKCLDTGRYSDLIITCGSDTYKVHKMIVCTRASFFARAIKFGGKEASEGKVDLPDDEPAIIKLLVDYLYEGEYEPLLPDKAITGTGATTDISSGLTITRTLEYNDNYSQNYTYDFPHTCGIVHNYGNYVTMCPHHICGQHCDYTCKRFICDICARPAVPPIDGPASQTLTHAKMYEIADKYDVVGLKDLAREKFKRSCSTFWDKDKFSTAAHYAFCTTMADDKGLRDIISSTISDHMELIQKPEIQALLAEHNGLSLGIMLKKADEHGWVKR